METDWVAEAVRSLRRRRGATEQDTKDLIIRPALRRIVGYAQDEILAENQAAGGGRHDFACTDPLGRIDLIVEAKRPDAEIRDAGLEQLQSYLEGTGSRSVKGLLTNGIRWIFVNARGGKIFEKKALTTTDLRSLLKPAAEHREARRKAALKRPGAQRTADAAAAARGLEKAGTEPGVTTQQLAELMSQGLRVDGPLRGTEYLTRSGPGWTATTAQYPAADGAVPLIATETPRRIAVRLGNKFRKEKLTEVLSRTAADGGERGVEGVVLTGGPGAGTEIRVFARNGGALRIGAAKNAAGCAAGGAANEQLSALMRRGASGARGTAETDELLKSLDIKDVQERFYSEIGEWFQRRTKRNGDDLRHLLRIIFCTLLANAGDCRTTFCTQ